MAGPLIGPELAQRIRDLKVGTGEMAIWWLGQSSYLLEGNDGKIFMVDPYFPTERPADVFIHRQPPLRGPDLAPDFVFCTHDHLDHTHPEYLTAVTLHHPNTTLFLTADGVKRMAEAGVANERMTRLSVGGTVEMGEMRVRVLRSKTVEAADTDHFAYIFEFAAGKVLHTGDMMRGITSIPELMEPLIAERPDVALLTMTPEEGGEFPSFAEGAELARKIGARVAIPAHYGCFVSRDYDPNQFAAQFSPRDASRPVIIAYCGCYIYPR